MSVEHFSNTANFIENLYSDLQKKTRPIIRKNKARGYDKPDDTIYDILDNSLGNSLQAYSMGLVTEDDLYVFLGKLRGKLVEIANKRGDMPNALEKAHEIWEATINHPEVTDPKIRGLTNPFSEEVPTQT